VPNLGQRPQALQKYDAAARHAAAAAGARADGTTRLTQARIAASRGDVLLAQGALGDARTSYESSVALVRRVLDESGDDVAARQMLAGIYRPLGEVWLAEGKPDEALKILEQARALDLAALARRPDDTGSQRLLALTELRIAEALAAAGRKTEAVDAYREASRLLGALSDREPSKARLSRDIAVSRMKLARLLDADGDPRALAELQQAVEAFRQLARLDPRNAGAQRDLLVSLVALGDIVGKSEEGRGRARASYGEAQRIAETLRAEPFSDPEAERDVRVVRERLSPSADAIPAVEPVLRLSVVRNGAEVPVDKRAAPPVLGEDLRVSWRPAAGRVEYVLSIGGEGRATLMSSDELAAQGGRLRTNGPPPSQTLLLLTLPRALADAEREQLVDRVSQAPAPREVPLNGHILWRTEREVLDTTATARGDAVVDWTSAVRRALEQIPGARFDGRTFPIARR
jgi:tetratricopeptide (TPR) repeat protein